MPLVRRALKVLSDREVSPQLGLLKSTLLQLDSTFSERTYGVGSFRDFAEKLAAAGYVTLRENGRNILVELKEDSHHQPARPRQAPSRLRSAAARRATAHPRRRRRSRDWPTASATCVGCSRRRRTRRAGRCTFAR